MIKLRLLPLMAAALASGTAGCAGTSRLLAQDLALRSLYLDGQDARAARGTREGGDRNPCFQTRTAATGQTGLQALEMRHGAFMEWCRAAMDAELRTGAAFMQSAAGVDRSEAITFNRSASDYAIERYLDSGIALSNQLCAEYFERMGLSEAAINFGEGLVSDIGSAASGIQSVTGVAPRAIGVTASIFGLTSSSLRNGRDSFIFDGNIESVYYLAIVNRQTYVQSMRGDPPATFWRTYDWLNSYHMSCSYMAIHVMVDDALSERAREAAAGPTADTTTALLSRVSRRLGVTPDFSETDLVAAVAMHLTSAADVEDYENFRNSEFAQVDGGEATTLSTLFADPDNRELLNSVLLTSGRGVYGDFYRRARIVIDDEAFAGSSGEDSPPPPPPPPAPAEHAPPPSFTGDQ